MDEFDHRVVNEDLEQATESSPRSSREVTGEAVRVAEVLLGVSGGIAAYKSVDVMRILQRRGHGVTVVMTAIGAPLRGAGHLRRAVRPPGRHRPLRPGGPRRLRPPGARARPDLLLVSPASANTIARMAAASATGCSAPCYLAFDGPVLIAPAMNTRMWLHPATAAATSAARRARREVSSSPGRACSPTARWGWAAWPSLSRSPTPPRRAWPARGLAGRRVLVSAGAPGSRSTRSATSATGPAAGWAGRSPRRPAAGARRSRCSHRTSTSPGTPDVRYVDAPTAADLHGAALEAFASCDVLVMAAAVADFAPARRARGKIDKGPPGAACPRPGADGRHPHRPRRPQGRPGGGRLRRRARPRAGSRAPEADRASASISSCTTTSRSTASASAPPTTRSPHRRRRGSRPSPHEQGGLRRPHPRRSALLPWRD